MPLVSLLQALSGVLDFRLGELDLSTPRSSGCVWKLLLCCCCVVCWEFGWWCDTEWGIPGGGLAIGANAEVGGSKCKGSLLLRKNNSFISFIFESVFYEKAYLIKNKNYPVIIKALNSNIN